MASTAVDNFVKIHEKRLRFFPAASYSNRKRVQATLQGCKPCPKSLHMTKKNILIHPDPRLKKVCSPIGEITAEVGKLAEDMLETMYEAPGIGLAAPQVGELRRMLVIDCIKDEDAEPRPMVLINPEITWSSDETNTYEEGCLSIPEQFGEVVRPAEVRVSWTGLDGKPQEEQFEGLWATCVQHEIDHLNGKLFIDYLGPMRRQMITRKMVKLKKERARA